MQKLFYSQIEKLYKIQSLFKHQIPLQRLNNVSIQHKIFYQITSNFQDNTKKIIKEKIQPQHQEKVQNRDKTGAHIKIKKGKQDIKQKLNKSSQSSLDQKSTAKNIIIENDIVQNNSNSTANELSPLITNTNSTEKNNNLAIELEEDEEDEDFSEKQQIVINDGQNYEKVQAMIDKNDPINKFVFKTKYGFLKLINSSLSDKQLENVNCIIYVHNTIPTNYIKKIFKSERNCLIVFVPESHYQNIQCLYKSAQRMINRVYFGTQKKLRNPFGNCKTPQDIFNLHRRILIEQKSFLNRICLIANYDGTLRIKQGAPISTLIKSHMNSFYQHPELSYQKHDFLISIPSFQGIHSAENYEKQGIPIKALNNKKIFPLYGVWPPTQQHLYKLFQDYLQELQSYVKAEKTAIDLGCGTGILGFIFCDAIKDLKMYAIDKNENAIKCAKLNSQIMDIGNRYIAQQLDLNEIHSKPDNITNKLDSQNFPKLYDFILANPPWLVANNLSANSTIENGVYDPKEQFLKSIFEFSKRHLNLITKQSKKGRLLLLYSDISEKLGLQKKNQIDELCKQYKLVITNQISTKFLTGDDVANSMNVDPLFKYKSDAKAILYEIQRA